MMRWSQAKAFNVEPFVGVIGIATLGWLLTVLLWWPSITSLTQPSGDQVVDEFLTLNACHLGYRLGWVGDLTTSQELGIFKPNLVYSLYLWLSCKLGSYFHINAPQSMLLLGQLITYVLTAVSCKRIGFHWLTCLLVAVVMANAPCAFSRLGHLSLVPLWQVIPGLLACLELADTTKIIPGLGNQSGQKGSFQRGFVSALFCLPANEYYTFFTVLIQVSWFGFLLFCSVARGRSRQAMVCASRNGTLFLVGFILLLLVDWGPKILASHSLGAPLSWASPREANQQFLYGLLPFTLIVPSNWIPVVRETLASGGIPTNTESFFWSAGSLLIPISWLVASWVLIRSPVPSHNKRYQQSLALLLLVTTFLGLMWMTMGGLGTLFAAAVSPVLRSLNRFTVFIYGASVLMLSAVINSQFTHERED